MTESVALEVSNSEIDNTAENCTSVDDTLQDATPSQDGTPLQDKSLDTTKNSWNNQNVSNADSRTIMDIIHNSVSIDIDTLKATANVT